MALRYKFTQDQASKNLLLETGTRPLVAFGYDIDWATGDEPLLRTRSQDDYEYPGRNQYGLLLSQVRNKCANT